MLIYVVTVIILATAKHCLAGTCNTGIAIPWNGEVECVCPPYKQGKYCTEDVPGAEICNCSWPEIQNTCASNPCYGGECINLFNGKYKCLCLPGIRGDRCSEGTYCFTCQSKNHVNTTCVIFDNAPYLKTLHIYSAFLKHKKSRADCTGNWGMSYSEGILWTASGCRATFCISFNEAQFASSCLAKHNQVRSLHIDTPAMTYSTLAASTSQAWADDLASRQAFEHSDSANQTFRTGGENLYLNGTTGTAADFPDLCANGIQAWYDEISDYNYASPGYSSSTGHFTQVVWAASIEVGCGSSRYTDISGFINTLIVCQYVPAGNIAGEFAAQVKPIIAGQTSAPTTLEPTTSTPTIPTTQGPPPI